MFSKLNVSSPVPADTVEQCLCCYLKGQQEACMDTVNDCQSRGYVLMATQALNPKVAVVDQQD